MTESEFASRRLHFVGIGGVGMSGLALVAHEAGARVTGSDRATSTYLEALREHGIEITMGNAAENVPDGAEVVYSTVVPPENPERQAAKGRELHRSQLLGQLAALRRAIAITGTNGKTTTAAMLVHVLRACGLDPAYVIGGELRSGGPYAAWGKGDWIVVEADESDRSLLNLRPEIALLTSAELDHHSAYGSRLELEETLRQFVARATRAVVVWNRPALRALCPPDAIPYDAPDPLLNRGQARFAWRGLEVVLRVPGAHNAINAAGALEAAALAGADAATAAGALSSFTAVHRRLELLGKTPKGAAVYDDYSHNPAKIAAAIDAVRTFGPRRVVAVFQPHRYSRTVAVSRELGAALARADVAAVLDIYPASERVQDYPGVTGMIVAAAAAEEAAGRQVGWVPSSMTRAPSWTQRSGRATCVCSWERATSTPWRVRSCSSAGPGSTLRSVSDLPRWNQRDYPLARLTTIRTGGAAELFARAGSVEKLERLLEWAAHGGHEVGVVGSGSNLLVADEGVRGLVLKLDEELGGIEILGTRIHCGGGARLPTVAARAARAGLAGIEFGVSIPGTVGGAVRMNANAYGGDLARVLEWVDVVTAAGVARRTPGQLGFSYRRSTVRPGEVVARACFALEPAQRDAVTAKLAELRSAPQGNPALGHPHVWLHLQEPRRRPRGGPYRGPAARGGRLSRTAPRRRGVFG